MKDKLIKKHIELLRMIETADSERQAINAELRLQGFEMALEIAGIRYAENLEAEKVGV
jgi:hypothetical protein